MIPPRMTYPTLPATPSPPMALWYLLSSVLSLRNSIDYKDEYVLIPKLLLFFGSYLLLHVDFFFVISVSFFN